VGIGRGVFWAEPGVARTGWSKRSAEFGQVGTWFGTCVPDLSVKGTFGPEGARQYPVSPARQRPTRRGYSSLASQSFPSAPAEPSVAWGNCRPCLRLPRGRPIRLSEI
jgi:hypothetical protein